jgi:hypothetical protein
MKNWCIQVSFLNQVQSQHSRATICRQSEIVEIQDYEGCSASDFILAPVQKKNRLILRGHFCQVYSNNKY